MYLKAIGPERFKFYTLESFSGEYFYKIHTESEQYNALQSKHIDRLFKNMRIILPIMLLAHGIGTAAPLYAIFIQHIRTTPAGIHLPCLEKDSNLEFTLNMISQAIMAFYLLFGDLAIEMASCMINNAIVAMPDLIRFNLREFQKDLKIDGVDKKALARLDNVFLQILDFNRFESPI